MYDLKQILSRNCNKHPIKVVFFPVAEKEFARVVLSQIKTYIEEHPTTTFIILNAFCDMTVPQMIYRLKMSNIIMINLFVIANDRRFKEIMANNIEVTSDNFDWFVHNHFIANEGVKLIAQKFQLYQLPSQQLALLRYQSAVQEQASPPKIHSIEEAKEVVGILKQYAVCPQEHGNLCGYHALSTLLCLEQGQDIQSKEM